MRYLSHEDLCVNTYRHRPYGRGADRREAARNGGALAGEVLGVDNVADGLKGWISTRTNVQCPPHGITVAHLAALCFHDAIVVPWRVLEVVVPE